ncbi:ESX-5 secretion system protein EccC5 [Streptomyces sp. MH192]|nr:ESX-5 secretion system protein EccC5 [Streptomyces sp. MH192]
MRLGTADLPAAPDGTGPLLSVPVTTGLREVGSLGLAGPRARLGGLARAVLAQLAALHSPDALELVLISADRARPVEERTAEWSWLGWLPHLVPAHGQDCRLLLAHDREQAVARTAELLRRLDDRLAEPPSGATARVPRQAGPGDGAEEGALRRPSWARDGAESTAPYAGPRTVLVVDGDPGGPEVREAVVRLVREGPRAGIHVICLAETAAASPAAPAAQTYEAVCAASPTFRECGAVALIGGDVATAVHVLRVASHPEPATGAPRPTGPEGHGFADGPAPYAGDALGEGPGAPTARARGAPRPHRPDAARPGRRRADGPGPGERGHPRRRGRGVPGLGRALRPGARPVAHGRTRRRFSPASGDLHAAAPQGPAAGRVGAGPRHPRLADGPLGGRRRRHRVAGRPRLGGARGGPARPGRRGPRRRRPAPAGGGALGQRSDGAAAGGRRLPRGGRTPGPPRPGADRRPRLRAARLRCGRRAAAVHGPPPCHHPPGRQRPRPHAGVRAGAERGAEAARRTAGPARLHPVARAADGVAADGPPAGGGRRSGTAARGGARRTLRQ